MVNVLWQVAGCACGEVEDGGSWRVGVDGMDPAWRLLVLGCLWCEFVCGGMVGNAVWPGGWSVVPWDCRD